MKVLLVDNYDSFTHNLYHLIARVGGFAPTITRNDDPRWSWDRLAEFDCVVISPGPGHPKNPRDFGICREIIARGAQPLLGICLGHQGLCLNYASVVDKAPEPRHGRISDIRHSGTDIFSRIPSPLSVVRYHSLAVTELSPELEPLAWAEDGVLMAVRHRTRPQWGIQFHPESIGSQYGERLLANFLRFVSDWRDAPENPAAHVPAADDLNIHTPLRGASAAATGDPELINENHSAPRAAPTPYRIICEKTACVRSTQQIFAELFRPSPWAAWLDSSRRAYGSGRFSVLCDASGPEGRVVTYDLARKTLHEERADGITDIETPFFDWLERELASVPIAPLDMPFEFNLGWVGSLGYELKAECGSPGPHSSPLPDACMMFATRAVVVDHEEGSAYILGLARPDDDGWARRWITTATHVVTTTDHADRLPDPTLRLKSPLLARHAKSKYFELIERSKQKILQGETYEVCLTNTVTAECELDPWTVYTRLRQENPAPFGAYLQLGALSVLSCSPELFISVARDGRVETKPIKGTRPRGKSDPEDLALKEDLRHSEKDRAENLMIVDLARNDLGRTARNNTVEVPALFEIESYQTVHQMVSTVRSQLKHGVSAVRCVKEAFPGGSMTGAPKLRTMEILDELEGGPRGVYSGALGYFSLCGAVELSMVIRTLVMAGGELSFGIGGAITALSDPESEFEEIRVKAAAFTRLFAADFE